MNTRVREAFTLMLVSAALSGCTSFHRKPTVAAAPPPDVPELSQTPLYSPAMNENAPRLPSLPATSDAAVVKPPPPPEKPHRVKKPKPVKPPEAPTAVAASSPTSAGTMSTPPETSPAVPSTIEKKQPVLQASASPAAATPSPIGDLTAGSTADAEQTGHHTEDLVKNTRDGVQNIRRNLSPDEKKTVSEIWTFLNRAEQALKNGDVDGAYGLATKAKLLLDELTQQ